jgi:hypothetical protein
MYAIICDARKGYEIRHLALVDRKLSRALWWTSDSPKIAICYESKAAAEFACRSLTKNNAQVVPFVRAQQILNEQRDARREIEKTWMRDAFEREGNQDRERGWDAHKEVF